MSDLLTVTQVAKRLQVSQSTVYSEVREGKIPHVKVRKRILFREDKLEAWLENQPSNSLNNLME
jgi:excisionase family DNA binding protein